MYNILNITKWYIWEKFWMRGASYFLNWSISEISFRNSDDSIMFRSVIEWSYDFYNVDLWLSKTNNSLIVECDCISFRDNKKCKHLWALARQIDKDYIINDDFSLLSKEEEELRKRSLNILNSIWNINSDSNHEENLYKIKLDFTKKWNIYIWIFKWKILKNWNLSAWVKVYVDSIDSFPLKYRKLKTFLESRWSNSYWSSTPAQMTFLDDPEIFINLIKDYSPIYNKNNEEIFIEKEQVKLKIKHSKLKEGWYGMYLVLIFKSVELKFKDIQYYWTKSSPYFACLTKQNHLLFWKTDLSHNFITSIWKNNLLLTEEQFENFKKWPYFENLLDNLVSIEDLGVDYTQVIPENKLLIEISNNFDYVKVEHLYSYIDKSIIAWDDQKTNIFYEWKIIKRDFKKESELKKQLVDIIDLFDEKEENYIYTKYVDDNIDDFFTEIEKLIEQWMDVEYKQTTKRITNKELWASVNIASWEDWFDAKVSMTLWDEVIDEAGDIILALKQWKNRITLKNGMTILLKDKLQSSFKELEELWINEKNIDKNVKISKYNIGLLRDKNKKWDLIDFSLDKEILKLKKSLTDFKWITKIDLSKNVKASLREYQKQWYEWLNFLSNYNFSWILADDMWLWKTLQTLAILQKEYDVKTLKTASLIVCPTSLVLNWMDEAEKFTPKLKVEYIKNGKIWFDDISKDAQVIIVSYGMMANLVDADWFDKKFHYLVLDEAQNIKNPIALRTKSIWKIQAKYRLALSWTPIENNLMELWSIFNFLMPWFLWNLSAFKYKYITELWNMKILSSKVKPFILRRTKEEVLKDLPPKVEEIIKLEMWDKQKAFYNKLKTTFRLQITKELEENWLNKARFQVLDSLLKLRQACLMPELVNMEWNKLTESIKIKYIEENIEEMIWKWHNLLIFSQFTGFLKYVKVELDKKAIKYNYLDGQTKKEERKRLVDSFNKGDVNVFIISLKAWGTWLNLTSADYVIHLDPWWNPAVESQATDRAHRMWQEKTVFVQKLIVSWSIEEKILTLQEKKKKLIDDVFSGNFTGNLSESDIKFIFE